MYHLLVCFFLHIFMNLKNAEGKWSPIDHNASASMGVHFNLVELKVCQKIFEDPWASLRQCQSNPEDPRAFSWLCQTIISEDS